MAWLACMPTLHTVYHLHRIFESVNAILRPDTGKIFIDSTAVMFVTRVLASTIYTFYSAAAARQISVAFICNYSLRHIVSNFCVLSRWFWLQNFLCQTLNCIFKNLATRVRNLEIIAEKVRLRLIWEPVYEKLSMTHVATNLLNVWLSRTHILIWPKITRCRYSQVQHGVDM